MDFKYVDIHTHAYEYSIDVIRKYVERGIVLVVVSEDYPSSRITYSLSEKLEGIIPCVGLHPWNIKNEDAVDEALKIVDFALENNIRCLGEIGLDTRFVGDTIEAQRKVLEVFLDAARRYELFVNLHTAGTWAEVLDYLEKWNIRYANFHWYTGPLYLIERIEERGYTISVNPAVKIQHKHRKVVEESSLAILLSESDSPYNYRGMSFTPELVIDVVREIAGIKNLETKKVNKSILDNFLEKYSRVLGITT